MTRIIPGRFTAHTDEPVVVFLIGIRLNNLLAVRKWVPTFLAMPPMLRELRQHPEQGFLGAEFVVYWRGVALLQYWRSFEHLERFARDPDARHLPAWRRFNRVVGADGTVGVWHETYLVRQGEHEAIYDNMPVFGLAAATAHVSAKGRRATARRRLGGDNEPAVPAPAEEPRAATPAAE